jgi:hypothetical protein
MRVHLYWRGPFFVKLDADARPGERARALLPSDVRGKQGIYVLAAERKFQPWSRCVYYVGETLDQTFIKRMEQHFQPRNQSSALRTRAAMSTSFNNNEIWAAEEKDYVVTVWLGELKTYLFEAASELKQAEKAYIYLLGAEENSHGKNGPDKLINITNSIENVGRTGTILPAWSPTLLPNVMNVYPKNTVNAWAECFFQLSNSQNKLRRRYASTNGSLWKRDYSEQSPI